MAESDTILQLGIEAAREGNRDEARNLFSLLTRQEPDNTQAWLWLAGVADSQDERRAALERVIALDPSNEMASNGLAKMGVDPSSVAASSAPVAPVPVSVPTNLDDDFATTIDNLPPGATASTSAPGNDEERYAAELDSAFDDYDEVEKVGGGPRNLPTDYTDDDAAGAATLAGSSSARDRVASRRGTRRTFDSSSYENNPPARRGGLSSIALWLIGIILLLLLGTFLFRYFQDRNGGVAISPTTESTASANQATADAGALLPTNTGDTSGIVSGTGDVSGTGTVTDTGAVTPPAPQETPQVQPPVTGTNPDPATANPQQVPVGTVLNANGFSYSFPDATYATSLGATVGGNTAQNGRYAVVLMLISNTSGTAQAIPADLFVIKDAQGRVYSTNGAVSKAYVIPGVNADKSLEDQLPADGVSYSVALVFDVAPDATNLVLFTRPNQGQGFLVLNAVP